MKMIKVLVMAMVLSLPMMARAELDNEAQIAMSNALGSGDIKIVKQYLDSGVDVNNTYFAWSGLQIATNHDQLKMVKFLVERGADVNYTHPVTKMTALSMAAFNGNQEIVKYLISKGANVNVTLKDGASLVYALRDLGHGEMADLLVAAGAKEAD